MRKSCPVCGSSKYKFVNDEFRCAKCHFISRPKTILKRGNDKNDFS